MATKKSTKGVAVSKTKKQTKKAAVKASAKSGVKAKVKAGAKAPAKASPVKKVKSRKLTDKTKMKDTLGSNMVHHEHGQDLYLIPVTGEIHPARKDEAPRIEKTYKHNEEIAFHREQQLAKEIRAGAKRVFRNPRQS